MFSKVALSTVTLLQLSSFTSAALPNIAGWSLTFSDDFTGAKNAPPDQNKWLLRTGTSNPGGEPNWGTGEIETYTTSSANVGQSGMGGLWITPRKAANGQWTSARVESKRADFICNAGQRMLIQAGIQMPNVNPNNGLGYWPAFWTMGADFRGNYRTWPRSGEFDIMENVNGNNFNNQGMHCGTLNPPGPCNEPVGLSTNGQCVNSICQGNWHTYAVTIDRKANPETITWTTDGRVTRVVRSTDIGSDAWNAAVHQGVFIVMNVAIGGAYANAVAGKTTPTAQTIGGVPMKVDYVGVWHQ